MSNTFSNKTHTDCCQLWFLFSCVHFFVGHFSFHSFIELYAFISAWFTTLLWQQPIYFFNVKFVIFPFQIAIIHFACSKVFHPETEIKAIQSNGQPCTTSSDGRKQETNNSIRFFSQSINSLSKGINESNLWNWKPFLFFFLPFFHSTFCFKTSTENSVAIVILSRNKNYCQIVNTQLAFRQSSKHFKLISLNRECDAKENVHLDIILPSLKFNSIEKKS